MSKITFGDVRFRVTTTDFEAFENSPRHSQVQVAVAGDDWVLNAPGRYETLGVISDRLAGFAAASAVRHWGSFVGLQSIEEVIDRVQRNVYGGEDPSTGDFHRWEMSSALGAYSLAALFESGLGVDQAISVRGVEHETLIWRTFSGEVKFAAVPNNSFDAACSAFVEWSNKQMGNGH